MIKLTAAAFSLVAPEGDLGDALQLALQLEHATIPPYLYTLYSLRQGANPRIYNLIRGIVKEEMAHFAIVCNLLNAIGREPVIANASFVPEYPSVLPGYVQPDLRVNLAPFSLAHIRDVFMRIEEPESPIEFPKFEAALVPPRTIGAFYLAIRDRIVEAGDAAFTGNPQHQVTSEMVELPDVAVVTNVADAVSAIEHIIEQGEGTAEGPTDDQARLAHYYRFAQIYNGRQLVRNEAAPPDAPPAERYAYRGPPIAVNAAGIYPLRTNPKAAEYPPEARTIADDFNAAYKDMLGRLQRAFTGAVSELPGALDVMRSTMTPLAQQLAATTLEDGTRPGPTFEYRV
jgi:hypothetical protein